MLTFIIPVVSKHVCADWTSVMTNLKNTLDSVENQTIPEWRVLIVSQTRPDINLENNPNIIFIRALTPAAAKPSTTKKIRPIDIALRRRANDIDRLRKLRIGAQALHQYSTDYVMNLEADDLVNSRLCEFVEANKDRNGWYLNNGYIWNGCSNYLYKENEFWKHCGSSWVVKVFYETLPEEIPMDVDSTTLRLVSTGCTFLDYGHRKMAEGMARNSTPIVPLPFAGVVYKKGHGGNLSEKYAPNIMSTKRIDYWPRQVAAKLKYYRNRLPLSNDMRNNFSINAAGLRDRLLLSSIVFSKVRKM